MLVAADLSSVELGMPLGWMIRGTSASLSMQLRCTKKGDTTGSRLGREPLQIFRAVGNHPLVLENWFLGLRHLGHSRHRADIFRLLEPSMYLGLILYWTGWVGRYHRIPLMSSFWFKGPGYRHSCCPLNPHTVARWIHYYIWDWNFWKESGIIK